MRIVVDVMGGDHGCEVVIEGVKIALHACNKISGLASWVTKHRSGRR